MPMNKLEKDSLIDTKNTQKQGRWVRDLINRRSELTDRPWLHFFSSN